MSKMHWCKSLSIYAVFLLCILVLCLVKLKLYSGQGKASMVLNLHNYSFPSCWHEQLPYIHKVQEMTLLMRLHDVNMSGSQFNAGQARE